MGDEGLHGGGRGRERSHIQPPHLPTNPHHAEHPWTTEHSPGGMRSSGGTARSPSGGGGRSPGRGGGGGMAAAGGGDGPGREGSGGGTGVPSAGAAGAPLELGLGWRSRGVKVGGQAGGAGFAPHHHSLNTDTCSVPGRGAARCGHRVGRRSRHPCTNPFPHPVPQFPHWGPSL